MDVPATSAQIRIFEEVMSQLRLSSGVYRTTFRGRFLEFNKFLNERIAAQFDKAAPLRIEDWAASDCLTSSEWAASVLPLFPAATLTASDLTLFLIDANLPDGSSYVVEVSGEALQYIKPPFVIRMNPSEPSLLLVNSFLEKRARAQLQTLQPSWKIPDQWLFSEDAAPYEQKPYIFRKIPVTHPDARALTQNCPRFAIRRHSVFEPAKELCDVIRTMNIFNVSYFSNDRLLIGARAVAQSVRPNGLWIVGRTYDENPPAHNASLFIREGNGFRLLERWGKGSEIEQIVLDDLRP
jgi:hypothetical protein